MSKTPPVGIAAVLHAHLAKTATQGMHSVSFCLQRLQSEIRCRDNLITALHFAPAEIRADVYLSSASVTELEFVFDNRAETAMQFRMQLGKAVETSMALRSACVVSLEVARAYNLDGKQSGG